MLYCNDGKPLERYARSGPLTDSLSSSLPSDAPSADDLRIEDARLAKLKSYGLDQLEGDAELNQLAKFAAQLCETPAAMINLIGRDDQILLAGFGVPQSPSIARKDSLCAYTMTKPGFVEIRDAASHPDVANFAGVIGDPKMRFYAAWPLVSDDGAPLGSMSVWDTMERPEGLSDLQRDGLGVLATAVMRRLTDHRQSEASQRAVQLSEEKFRIFADSIPDIAWSSDGAGNFEFFNQRWFDQLGVECMPEGGWRVLFHPDDREDAIRAWTHAIDNGLAFESEFRILDKSGQYLWHIARAVPIRSDDGDILNWYGTLTDIDERYRISEERELLAGELAHRIKNIFSVVSGLVSLHARGDETLAVFAKTLTDTIRALSRAQDFALKADAHADAGLKGLLQVLMAPYGLPGSDAVAISGDDVPIGVRSATPLALVFHELATNSAKYGALSVPEGAVAITLTTNGERMTITWRETGGPPSSPPEKTGFGSRLVKMAIQNQLGGTIAQDWRASGLEASIEIPKERLKK